MVKLPDAPKWADFKNQARKYVFTSKTVNAETEAPVEYELDAAFQFIGIVAHKDEPVFRAVFMKAETPFETANKEYEQELDAIVAEAEASGATINSLNDLEAWAGGVAADNVVDFTAISNTLNGLGR